MRMCAEGRWGNLIKKSGNRERGNVETRELRDLGTCAMRTLRNRVMKKGLGEHGEMDLLNPVCKCRRSPNQRGPYIRKNTRNHRGPFFFDFHGNLPTNSEVITEIVSLPPTDLSEIVTNFRGFHLKVTRTQEGSNWDMG